MSWEWEERAANDDCEGMMIYLCYNCLRIHKIRPSINTTFTCICAASVAIMRGKVRSRKLEEVIAYGTWGEKKDWPVDWKERIMRE